MKKRMGRAGFSLIEVLVATALLTVIVMMIGTLFQQSSIAWRTGVNRAEGFTQIRSFVGTLQRDASQAVDIEGAKALRERIAGKKAKPLTENQSFGSGSLVFYTLSGTNRSLVKVSYTDLTRTEEDVLGTDPEKTSVLVPPAGRQIDSVSYLPKWPDGEYGKTPGGEKGLPLYLTIKAKVSSSDYSADIGAASAGPDRTWGTKDDITTWSKK